MSIAAAAGQTYTGSQVSVGGIVDFGNSTKFTETANNNPDTLSITSVFGNTVQFTYTSGTSTLSAFATTLANDDGSFILTYINGNNATNFYVSNTAQADVVGNTATLPDEAYATVYKAPCYCPGTLIRTANGDVAVEDLRIGDSLVTVSGQVKAIRWIGKRSYSGRFFTAKPDVWPVRFRAGSLGADASGAPVPGRDLLVSPEHAMLIDGVLVPARLLVNGASIVRDGSAREVSYFHVELPEHDAIWAENAASETFIDDRSRRMFQNAATFDDLYPDAAVTEPVFCAPRVDGGAKLDEILRGLVPAQTDDRLAA